MRCSKPGQGRWSRTVLRHRTYATCQTVCVAGDCCKLRSAAQLPLQFKNPFVICAARNPWWQVVRKDAYTPLGNRRQRRLCQHGSQPSDVNSRTLPPYRDSWAHSAVRPFSVASKSPAWIAALNTSPAWLRTRTDNIADASRKVASRTA